MELGFEILYVYMYVCVYVYVCGCVDVFFYSLWAGLGCVGLSQSCV